MLTKAEIQRLRSLRDKKEREAHGLFVIEGEKVVGELLGAGFPFTEIYATGDWLAGRGEIGAGGPGVAAPKVIAITGAEMTRASHFPTPSPVLALGRIERRPLARGELAQGLTLALDRLQDAGNVGTLLRIADWFGFDRVLLSPDSADLFHQKVINASMGSFARVRVHTVELAPALAVAAGQIPILGCDLIGDDVHTLAGTSNAVIVIGSEGRGLSPEIKPLISRFVTIPRFGQAESLNAAVAAAIVCDNIRRGN